MSNEEIKYNSPYPAEVTYTSDKNFMVRLKAMIERNVKENGIAIPSRYLTTLLDSLENAEDYLFAAKAATPSASREEGKGCRWTKASERLPGINKVVKWRNGAGGNIPLGENTFLDQYEKVGPNTSWHEWYDESPSAPVEQEGQEFVWTDEKVLEFAKLYRFSSSRCSIEQYKKDFTIL